MEMRTLSLVQVSKGYEGRNSCACALNTNGGLGLCKRDTSTPQIYKRLGPLSLLKTAENSRVPLTNRFTRRAWVYSCSSPLPNVAKRVADTVYKLVSRLKEWMRWFKIGWSQCRLVHSQQREYGWC